jgi:hypothetical protein
MTAWKSGVDIIMRITAVIASGRAAIASIFACTCISSSFWWRSCRCCRLASRLSGDGGFCARSQQAERILRRVRA